MSEIKQDIRHWWAANPMTYADEHGYSTYTAPDGTLHQVQIGTREFFEHADAVFYQWNTHLDSPQGHFGQLFDYTGYQGKRVLEVGCGMGCMAMNWAQHGAAMTAVDLNPVAIEQTRRRFEVFGLSGEIQEADSENLPFEDSSFDYAYSWGVLHHSPGIQKSIDELYRVVKAGAGIGVMLYHRNSLLYRYTVNYLEGYLHLENHFLDAVQLSSRYGDGHRAEGNPHTRPVTRDEVYQLFHRFKNVQIATFGSDLSSVLNTIYPGLGMIFPQPWKNALARRWGWSLWITGQKP